MSYRTFRLVRVLELVPVSAATDTIFRVEIFTSAELPAVYRCRIWSYRIYAATLALPSPPLVSHDTQSYEVSSLVRDPELIFGMEARDEDEFVSRVLAEIDHVANEAAHK